MYKWLNAAKSQERPPQFIEVTPPIETPKPSGVPSRVPGGDCVIRFRGAEFAIPPGFPATELTGILLAVKAAQ